MDKILLSTKPNISELPGGWEPKLLSVTITPTGDETPVIDIIPGAFLIEKAISTFGCKRLRDLMDLSPNFEGVSVQGNKDALDMRIGSNRTTMWCPELADALWQIIDSELPSERRMKDDTLTDWWQGDGARLDWKPIAVSPLLRFMKYDKGGQHYAHYDAGFIYPDDRYRTLQSFVIYLTTNSTGATRFIDDKQTGSIWNRKHEDWSRETLPEEVLASSYPKEGNILIFDHRMCHDVEKYLGDEGDRIIIRGDIVYKAKTK